jgi:hypothetical protein
MKYLGENYIHILDLIGSSYGTVNATTIGPVTGIEPAAL